jgi:hypothetical protein
MGTCVDIAASNVTLRGVPSRAGGPLTPTFEDHVEPTANKVFLEDLQVESFGPGIRIDRGSDDDN